MPSNSGGYTQVEVKGYDLQTKERKGSQGFVFPDLGALTPGREFPAICESGPPGGIKAASKKGKGIKCSLRVPGDVERSLKGHLCGCLEQKYPTEQFRIYYTHCYSNTHRKLLSSPRPLQSISRAHIIVRPLFSSLQPMFRAYRAYHVYYITIRHKPKQLAAGLLNIATAEIFSGLKKEPLQMSTTFSNFLVYGMKSLKFTEALCSTIGLHDARGRVGKKVARSLVVGIHRLPLKGVLPGWRMLLEEKRERHETGTRQSCHHGNVTQWHRACSSLLFSFFFTPGEEIGLFEEGLRARVSLALPNALGMRALYGPMAPTPFCALQPQNPHMKRKWTTNPTDIAITWKLACKALTSTLGPPEPY
ncbi:LOW QUALITY PROTEIN: uncharacterized protein LOC105739240 [Nomascus leucogenys]|uniref:LOW QUALITY PROTEIN: uncharacterized protein LOC105739240 n=1 Tax=Nomascus leucogenys TaxID=61853 RepID=UPI00062AA248|nr:LOW QUALITY PROTEIN: uncharacterized protein LOC105739240 [Nomascus leucogenys]